MVLSYLRHSSAPPPLHPTVRPTVRVPQVREINKYTLQDETDDGTVPRVGMYILQDERCWELLPPEEELDAWISKLQLAIFGQEVRLLLLLTIIVIGGGVGRVVGVGGGRGVIISDIR